MHPNHKKPIWIFKMACLALVIFGLGISPSFPSGTASLAAKKKTAATETVKNIQIPENLSPAEMDAYLASLDDKQVRQVLTLKLKDEAARNAIAETQGNGERERGKPNLSDFLFNCLSLSSQTVISSAYQGFSLRYSTSPVG